MSKKTKKGPEKLYTGSKRQKEINPHFTRFGRRANPYNILKGGNSFQIPSVYPLMLYMMIADRENIANVAFEKSSQPHPRRYLSRYALTKWD